MLKSQMKGYVETRGAKPFDHDRKKFSEYLLSLAESEVVLTNYMRHRLEDSGYITVSSDEPNGMRGRPPAVIDFTAKARPFLTIARIARTKAKNKAEAGNKKKTGVSGGARSVRKTLEYASM